jgi:quercetin dioxygenase-like cupin family protein
MEDVPHVYKKLNYDPCQDFTPVTEGGQQVTQTPGQSFYEGPDEVHAVDRNASGTQPAKFLVLLIKDKGAPALVPAQ